MEKGLTNTYVNRLSKQLLSKNFFGTFSCDRIKNVTNKVLKERQSFSLIINISPSSVMQGHFIALSFKASKNSLIIFDSLKLPFSDPNVARFLNQLKVQVPSLKIKYAKRQIQSFESNFCGYYVIGFLLSQDRLHETLTTYMRRFHLKPVKENDTIVLNYILCFIQKFGINE